MPHDLLHPEDIDHRLNWPPGRTSRLVRRRKLPHYLLPDNSVRLRWAEIEPLIKRVPGA